MRLPISLSTVFAVTRAALPLSLMLGIGGPRSTKLTPIVSEMIKITSARVTLDPANPTRDRVGRLRLVAGWALSSASSQFGGWSGLDVDGATFTAIGDFGSILRFRLTRFGRAVDAQIDPLPPGCGDFADRNNRDSESLLRTRAPLKPGWLVGFEAHHRFCRITPDFRKARAYAHPRLSQWRNAGGAEAMAALRDGRVLVFSESVPTGKQSRSLLVFSGDPATPGTPVVERAYQPPPGYSPTDAAELPDGRILVIHRRFSAGSLFTTILTTIDPAALDTHTVITGTPIAQFQPPVISDNFEGLAVTRENGETIVWMLSDDNFMSWQKTYLLKFVLDPPRKP